MRFHNITFYSDFRGIEFFFEVVIVRLLLLLRNENIIIITSIIVRMLFKIPAFCFVFANFSWRREKCQIQLTPLWFILEVYVTQNKLLSALRQYLSISSPLYCTFSTLTMPHKIFYVEIRVCHLCTMTIFYSRKL